MHRDHRAAHGITGRHITACEPDPGTDSQPVAIARRAAHGDTDFDPDWNAAVNPPRTADDLAHGHGERHARHS